MSLTKILVLLLGLIISFEATAQQVSVERLRAVNCEAQYKCADFENILAQLDRALKDQRVDIAISALDNLEACDKCPNHDRYFDDLREAIAAMRNSGVAGSTTDHSQDSFDDCDKELLCRDFAKILANVNRYLKSGDGANAYLELKALEACDKCPEHRDNLDAISDAIISLFRVKNDSLNVLLETQERTLATLRSRTFELSREREKVEQQFAINENMTRDALVSNYIRLANEYLLKNTEDASKEALWLTDFAYNYIDSTHHEVRKMMHRLLNDQLLEYYNYDPYYGGMESAEGFFEEESYEGRVSALEWSKDGEWLAAGLDNHRLIIFRRSGEVVFDSDFGEATIFDVSFNLNSNFLAFGTSEGMVNFLQLAGEDWLLTERMLEHNDVVSGLAWSPTVADQLAVATFALELYLYEKEETTPSVVFSGGHNDWVRDVAWAPDGTRIASCDDQGYVNIWAVDGGKLLHHEQGHTDYARTIDWHPAGHQLISGGDDSRLVIWDTTGRVIDRLSFEGWVYQARYSASGEDIGVVVGLDAFYRVTANDRFAEPLPERVTCFAWLGESNTVEPNNGLLLTDDASAVFELPQKSEGNSELQQLENVALQVGDINQVRWSPDGNYLAYAKENKFGIVEEEQISSFDFQGSEVLAMAWHPGLSEELPNSNFLATVDASYRLLLWDVPSRSIVYNEEIPSISRDLTWSPDGNYLATVNDAGALIVYDQELKKQYEEKIANDYIRAVDWSPDGRYLLMGSDDYSLIVFDWLERTVSARLTKHVDWIRDVCWLDDQHFASAADDSKTIIWSYAARVGKFQPVHTIDSLSGFHLSLAYLANRTDGVLAIGSSNNELGFWRLNSNFQPVLDTILALATTPQCLDWKPNTYQLAMSVRASVPQALKQNLELVPAFDAHLKTVESKSITEALEQQEGGLTSFFFLPKTSIAREGGMDQIAWSSAERYLATLEISSNSDGKTLTTYDMMAGKPMFTLELPLSELPHLLFSPDEKYLAATWQEDSLLLVTVANPMDSVLIKLSTIMMDWAWSPDSRYLGVLDQDYGLTLYDTETGATRSYATNINDYDRGSLLFHPAKERLLYIFSHQGVYELQADPGAVAKRVYEATQEVRDDLFTGIARGEWINGGKELLYVHKGNSPQLLAVERGSAVLKYKMGDLENYYTWTGAPAELLYEIHLPEDTKRIFKGKDREYARAWSIATGKPLSILQGVRKQAVEQMQLSPDGRLLATLGDALVENNGDYERGSSSISIWDLRTQEEVFELLAVGMVRMAFSPRGNYLYTFFENGQVGIWPLNVSRISNYFANAGKDRYLERISSKDKQPFRDRIEEWKLEKGINFREEENFELIRSREIARIRQNWGEYFIDQAWLINDEQRVEENFKKARLLHLQGGTQQVRPTLTDTLALVNVWMEETYYRISEDDDQAAELALRKAQRLLPGLNRLEMLQLLISWQEGDQEKVVRAMLAEQTLALVEEYANWDQRDIHIRNELLFQRLANLMQAFQDPISPDRDPLFKASIQTLSPEIQEELLLRYYPNNVQHPGLNTDGKSQRYYEEAIRFLESRWEKTRTEPANLESYVDFNFFLQQIERRKNKLERAVLNVRKQLRGVEQLLTLQPNAISYQEAYLDILAEEANLELMLNPVRADKIKESLVAAKNKYPRTSSYRLNLALGNVALVLKERNEAYQQYYQVLESKPPYFGLESEILEEVNSLASRMSNELESVFQVYADYREQKEELRANAVDLATVDVEASAEMLLRDYPLVYQQAKEWYESAVALEKAGMLPQDSLLQHGWEYNRLAGDYVYLLLLDGNSQDAQRPVEDIKQFFSEYRWPIAIEAILAVLKDDWPAARNRLNQIETANNDGIRPDQYPTLRAFLLDLPKGTQEHPNFQKRKEQWTNKLRR